jgi:magnesium chelatase family protein
LKISGPLLDRIEIQLEVPEVKFKDIVSRVESESSQIIKERVCQEEAGGAEVICLQHSPLDAKS